jgi:hypothetical protein
LLPNFGEPLLSSLLNFLKFSPLNLPLVDIISSLFCFYFLFTNFPIATTSF